jgi:Uma2 family endonuclease
VRNVWHVDPVAQTLEIFRLEGNHWLLVDSVAGDERVRAEPFESFELKLALVWAE